MSRSAPAAPQAVLPAAPRRTTWWALLLLAALVPVMVVVHWLHYISAPIPGLSEARTVEIAEDAGFGGALRALRDKGLVHNFLYFKILARWEGVDKKLRPGVYKVPAGSNPQELLALLVSDQDQSILLTIPEGWTMFHIADRVEDLGLAARADFLAAATDKEALRRFDIPGPSAEGYLFPDTYHLAPGASSEQILERMIRRHRKVWEELAEEVGPEKLAALQQDHGATQRDLLILASIVEREAVVDEERPIIARVFLNRLDHKMKLQADPTCTYSPKLYKSKASPASCKDPKNKYSTYVIARLPPTPIANPGKASLRAVLSPTERPDERDYLYFVAKPDGRRHTFSKNYQDHNDAIPR